MFKKILFFVFACFLTFSFMQSSCLAKTTTKKINKTLTLNENGISKKITGKGTFQKGSFKCSNYKVIKTTRKKNTFTVKARKPGTSKIKFKTYKKSGKNKKVYSYTYTITVKPKKVFVSSITIKGIYTDIEVGEEYKVSTIIKPSNATNKKLTWTSSNPSVAIISNDTVKGLAPGTTKFTATASDGSKVHVSFNVKVEKAVESVIPITDITIGEFPKTMKVGESSTLSVSILPINATNKTLSFHSLDPNVATVDETGKVTAVSAGTTTITVSSNDGSNISSPIVLNVEGDSSSETEALTNGRAIQ